MTGHPADEAIARTHWRRWVRVAAVLFVLATTLLFVHALLVADALALSQGRMAQGWSAWWWLTLPLWILALVLARARLPGATFFIAFALVAFWFLQVLSALRDPRASGGVWLYESVGFGSVLLWPGLLLVGVAALAGMALRRRRGAG